MIKTSKFWWAIFSVAACGCASDGEGGGDYEISDQTLQGTINADDWTFVSGYAEDVFDDGELWIELHSVAPVGGDPCSFSAYDAEPAVITTQPAAAVDVGLSLSTNITFSYVQNGQNENDVGTQGRLVIDKVTDNSIGGGLYAVFENSEVDGKWEVPICP